LEGLGDTYGQAINSLTRSLWVLLFLLSPFMYCVSNIIVFYGQNTAAEKKKSVPVGNDIFKFNFIKRKIHFFKYQRQKTVKIPGNQNLYLAGFFPPGQPESCAKRWQH
jgi:hypothetical protein